MSQSKFETEQENFWAGEFGNEYLERNDGAGWIGSNTAFFSRALQTCAPIRTVIEFGANTGLNLKALKILLPEAQLSGVEINQKAAGRLRELIGDTRVYEGSVYDYPVEKKFDLVLIKGVLIHLNPDRLKDAYQKLYQSSNKYILICEYYNPSPVGIPYRGNTDKLFKRDFAGEVLDMFEDLELVDYGFAYHRDNNFKQDDITWFLLKKG